MDNSQRRLAAIVFTDIVGYSGLMAKNEELTLSILEKNRHLHKTKIKQYNGRWLKEIGDGTLASFETVSDAVKCTMEIQKELSKQDEFKLRVGIHAGEVVFKDGDIFGDGVNIASRIESIAPVGGIAVSARVYGDIANKKIYPQFIWEQKNSKIFRNR